MNLPGREVSALRRLVKPEGDLKKPVSSGKHIGILAAEKDCKKVKAGSSLKYPILGDDPGLAFDPETRQLTTTRAGMVRFFEDGVVVVPLWYKSDDQTVLMVDVYAEDSTGAAITDGWLKEALPPEYESVELNFGAIRQALKKAKDGGAPVMEVEAAVGKHPQHGRDGELQLEFSTDRVSGLVQEDGTIDFRERGGVHFVGPDDLLATLLPPTKGVAGLDIFKREVPARDGVGHEPKLGENVRTVNDPTGNILYQSTATGVARFAENILSVSDLIQINGDLDFNTGNIHADHGSVHITGSIQAGFSVEAKGDVVVDGMVEEADITTGGDLVVGGGIILGKKNRIAAMGNVTAKFFQNATIRAQGDVTADAEITHCDIVAQGAITSLGNKGVINGGRLVCGKGLHANVLGSEAGARTLIEIRIRGPKEDHLLEGRNEHVDQLAHLDEVIGSDDALAELMSAPDEDRRILAELIKVRGVLQGEIRKIDEAVAEERRELEQQLAQLHIKAERNVYSGTEVLIGKKSLVQTENKDGLRYYWDLADRKIATE